MTTRCHRRTGRTARLLYGLVCLMLWATNAQAANPDVLPVDQAFAPQVTKTGPERLVVHWQIADGYYLYRHALHFALIDGGSAQLGAAAIPAGAVHQDAYFGRVETYRRDLRVRLPIEGALASSARIQIKYQGCADAGLCYPPQTRTLAMPAPPASHANRGPPDSPAADASDIAGLTTPAPEDGHTDQSAPDQARRPSPRPAADNAVPAPSRTATLAERLAHAPVFGTLALFLVLGLGLAFTPCILPMIPIVAGLIGSRDVSRGRAFVLALAYVLAMAAAYTVFGVVAGYFGTNIQAALQRPLVLLPFAGLFVLLAAASFGWFDFQIPSRWQTRLSQLGGGRAGILGAGGLGFVAALVAGPCLAPPLAGALLYISTSGNLWLGGAALFCLGLGMGLPLIALAVFGASALPRAGAWMQEIRVFFGVLLLAVGGYLALRLAPATLALAAWGLLALVYAVYLSTRSASHTATLMAKRLAVVVLGGYAALAAAGLAIGHGRPAAPLAGLALVSNAETAADDTQPAPTDTQFQRVTTQAGLQRALARAARAGKPALVDIYADWCVECVHMKHTVFTEPAVRRALADTAAIEFDVTDYTADQRRALKRLSIFGPPTLLFYDASGQRMADARVVGTIDAKALVARLHRFAPTP